MVKENEYLTSVVNKFSTNLVKFINVSSFYLSSEDLIVDFILDSEVKGSTKDWIGIFREDWNTYESCLIYQWGLGRVRGVYGLNRYIKFNKKDLDFALPNVNYQFVYIDKSLNILGISSFFKIMTPTAMKQRLTGLPNIQEKTLILDLDRELKKSQKKLEKLETEEIHLLRKKVEILQKILLNQLNQYWEMDSRTQYGVQQICPLLKDLNINNDGPEQRIVKRNVDFDFKCDDLSSLSQRELLMKAIIGNQELKINDLTKTLIKTPEYSKSAIHEDVRNINKLPIEKCVVTIVATQEKMLPTIFEINKKVMDANENYVAKIITDETNNAEENEEQENLTLMLESVENEQNAFRVMQDESWKGQCKSGPVRKKRNINPCCVN